MKKLLALIIMALTLAGCGGSLSDYEKVHTRLSEMTSYRALCEITYFTDKTSNAYEVNLTADSSGRYKMEALSPKDVEGNIILFDGNMIWLYNPIVENKLTVSSSANDSRREIILFTFLKNESVAGEETTLAAASVSGEKFITFEAPIPGGKKGYFKEKLFADSKTGDPKRLVIYGEDGSEHITVDFKSFEYNPELSAEEFKIAKELQNEVN